ncbi:hypothetical protein CU254_14700 [Amycolatopsis sp. AA4]|uniref:phage tail tube protein n=1 Tax=Actinomycetes TaxID=1760 RepID=UPI0001B54AD7|nr:MULTISPECIES: hypothetical protein [Actinomycetes]ATY11567.1 hypothetical protein CU254_14700 [Amycolatopsis sp. AA4]EFL07210.1 hypothetical protein SSMG_02881 [Streptomyces sp. AA4]
MTLRDEGYFIPQSLHVYQAAPGTPPPTPEQIAPGGTLPAVWKEIAHVADETGDGGIQLTRDGGDRTPKGSMAKKTIRVVTAAVVTGFELDFTQITRETLALYHGTQGGTVDGVFGVADGEDSNDTVTAFLAVWTDGAVSLGLHAPKNSWAARDNIDTSSTEDATRVPVVGTFISPDLVGGVRPKKFNWISPQLFPLS